MKINAHIKHSIKVCGVGGKDIHKWIDGLFDHKKFKLFTTFGYLNGFDPYEHRQHRHHQEALQEALKEFQDKYPLNIIEKIFETHIRDDYAGYYPKKEDFSNPQFLDKYHRH